MEHRRLPVLLVGGLVLFLISGCAYPISEKWRQQAKEDLTFIQVVQNPEAYIGLPI
jgi:hypothetical protein